jgi:hypothetical protein
MQVEGREEIRMGWCVLIGGKGLYIECRLYLWEGVDTSPQALASAPRWGQGGSAATFKG